jgi:outer membrane lipoprotein-sorting protein
MKEIKVCLAILVLLVTIFLGIAQAGWKETIPMDLQAADYESITVSSTAVGFTSSKLSNSIKGVFCTLENAQVRFRMDGTDPTATEGHLLEVGQSLTIYNWTILRKIKFIRTGSTDGVLKVTYLR